MKFRTGKIYLKNLCNIFIAKVNGKKTLKANWDIHLNNFGDCLTPVLLKHYGYIPIYVGDRNKSDILTAGSILQWVSENYDGIILGSGGTNKKYSFKKAKVVGLRGNITLNNIKSLSSNNIVLGDPGLIMNYVFPKKENKIYDIGIVPHYLDKSNNNFMSFIKNIQGINYCVIDVLKSPKEVINNIKKCKNIFSSSLHGLVIADAFNIPNARFYISETQPNFKTYKWEDYYSAIDSNDVPHELNLNDNYEDIIKKMRLHTAAVRRQQNILDATFKNLNI